MPTLLHIDSSPLGDASISRHLSHHFVEQWKEVNPDGHLVRRDLTETTIVPVTASWIGAVYTPDDARTPEQNEIISLSNTLLAELRAADEYVIGVPMHNFSIPSTLKLWIDQVARRGETFSYIDGKPEGLLKGKKATFITASGGAYDAGTAFASLNFVEPYLRSVFGFLGVIDTTFINAGGASAIMYGQIDRPTFLQPHLDSIRQQLQPARV
ncbi:FMN-dependent NADH-azoreductase [Granulicella sibirica]|uniref:FMN dependent NADH:quinone oxidoreductase n=1 Tax=Granulicella sibirica TaxID=2479048 RepID=A0A4Q0T3K4_9BACT|nr:NAD(P)H-dependent oxidoreductase [Granulicella sibirica]RXH56116.1 FMN-dependent NADH-azoreductase [Granulicella sibirica]